MKKKKFIKLAMADGISKREANEISKDVKHSGSFSKLYNSIMFNAMCILRDKEIEEDYRQKVLNKYKKIILSFPGLKRETYCMKVLLEELFGIDLEKNRIPIGKKCDGCSFLEDTYCSKHGIIVGMEDSSMEKCDECKKSLGFTFAYE